jgi:carbamoyl-phosphate synthase small subunit
VEHCILVLADGRTFPGRSFGAPAPTIDEIRSRLDAASDPEVGPLLATIGEVVFNTAMSGYVETLTDPSYTGQIVAMTYPHIGNYGVSTEWAESHAEPSVRPRPVMAAGFVVRSVYDGPVPDGRQRLTDFLADAGIPGISGVDTRALTLHLRNHGSKNGLILRPAAATLTDKELAEALEILTAFPAMEGRGLIGHVGAREKREIPPPTHGGRDKKRRGRAAPHLVLYDCGAKDNIVRELQNLGCRLTLLPSEATAAQIRETGADAVMISNGPGDPAVLQHQVEQTRELLGTMPVLGICLGHQIIAEAAGAKTSKMKFGHHGVNHPVRDEITRRVFVTSQNHGFTVEEASIPKGLDVWFRNANDQSIEGLRDDVRNIRTTQFHPESAPGPTDSRWIFEAFLEAIPDKKER